LRHALLGQSHGLTAADNLTACNTAPQQADLKTPDTDVSAEITDGWDHAHLEFWAQQRLKRAKHEAALAKAAAGVNEFDDASSAADAAADDV
jgi:hypothetical protein